MRSTVGSPPLLAFLVLVDGLADLVLRRIPGRARGIFGLPRLLLQAAFRLSALVVGDLAFPLLRLALDSIGIHHGFLSDVGPTASRYRPRAGPKPLARIRPWGEPTRGAPRLTRYP